jgi:hypothetical protein
MNTSFANLYMSHSMHELFNKTSVVAPEDAAAIHIAAPARPASQMQFTLDAMFAASDSYSVSEDLSQYASH